MEQSVLRDILWRNQGQTLTPELIAGILLGANYSPPRFIDISNFKPQEYKGYTFGVERYADVLPELKELHRLQWEETEKYRHGLPLNPDYDGFLREEYEGRLLLFTIRKDKELVGQSTTKLHVSMHTQTLVASEDSLFLRAEHRGGFMILAFIKYAINVLKSLGVKEVRVSSKLVNSADKLMMRAGFKPFAMQLVQMLGDDDAQ